MGAVLQRIDDSPVAASLVLPSVLVVGNFDGVHRGHAAVLTQAREAARARGLAIAALTFDPHPASVVGREPPPLLTTVERRAHWMEGLGVERVWVRRFDTSFAAWSPERFATELVAGALAGRVVVVGQNFRFGARRAGDLALLRTLGERAGFEVEVHSIASDDRGPYSSTRAREAVAAGDLEEVARVLGRPHELSGVVVRGDQRGRTLGFPTANLHAVEEMLPRDGVYAVRAERIDGDVTTLLGAAVTNLGVRPTVDGQRRTIEAHLLDRSEDLYGARLRLQLIARLRDEQRFAGLDALKAQIAADCAAARAVLASGA